jgi:hypothetical protein
LTRLINPESGAELQDHMMLAADVIELHAQKLKKIVVADELQITPGEVTDSKLTVFCDSDSVRNDPTDMLVLSGCHHVTDISCLTQLPTISHLDISCCSLGAEGGSHLAGVIKDMGALTLTSLDLSMNNLEADRAMFVAEAMKVTRLIV